MRHGYLSGIRLTRNFRLGEFAVSREYPDLAAEIIFTEREVGRLQVYCAGWLQPLRDHYGSAVIITSGKRTQALNKAIGGAPMSDHLFTESSGAADITLPGQDMREVSVWMRDNLAPVKKLLVYPQRGFVHISFPDDSGVLNIFGTMGRTAPGNSREKNQRGSL